MNESTDVAKARLLEEAEISTQRLDRVMGNMMAPGVDRGELFFQCKTREVWSLEDGIVKNASFDVDQGVGVRAINQEKTGFAHTNDFRVPALEQAINAAKSISRHGATGSVAIAESQQVPSMYEAIDPTRSLTEIDKVGLLSRLDTYTRALDSRIKQVNLSIGSSQDTMFVHSSDGTSIGDIRPLVSFSVSVIAEQNGRREIGVAGGGGRFDLTWLMENSAAESYAKEAVRTALLNLDAIDAPAGEFPVVLGPGWPGVLLHEAVGHGLEGDFNRKGSSVFSGQMGQKVASELCTVIDDATIRNRRGSLTIDDEGTPGQRTVLIEDGVLKGYMQDKLNAKLTGTSSTGNGRRQAYNCLTLPRMTNTFMLAGKSDPEEIIRSVSKGVYAVSFAGGQVDITSGKFVFSTTEAYLIEDGKVTAPLRGATLIGDGLAVMNRITMVGNDLALDAGFGSCGKEGQTVPVGVGQPTLKIDRLRIGGTST